MKLLIFFAILFVGSVANAAELSEILGTIGTALTMENPLIWGLGLLIELLCRSKKTRKPIGIIHGVAKTARAASSALEKLADVSDKIIPQRLK